MTTTRMLRAAALGMLVSACADNIPVEPTTAALTSFSASSRLNAQSDEVSSISQELADMNDSLAASGSPLQILKAEILYGSDDFHAANATVVFANNRFRGFGAEWVKGDPRRGGRLGVTYAIGSNTGGLPITLNASRTALVFAPASQVDAQLEEGMDAWRMRSCSGAPITRVAAGTNPDLMDELYRGRMPTADYAQPADIIHGMWQPRQFFWVVAQVAKLPPAAGDGIIGVTLTAIYVNNMGTPTTTDDVPTDIDRNGKADIGRAEIYYNQWVAVNSAGQVFGHLWSNTGEPGFKDYYSIITHETGHALGLNHFGKIFVTKPDAMDLDANGNAITVSELKFAPLAMMNALYVTGRSKLAGTDESSFCQIWASK
jgi:hypothetical protein